ncbi:MAG: hypothetical protein A2428_04970 [Bdellovibrionales bacterium RIFOXYC1_FULL_54_43]|nr:MAG: hypothetical protein A2428_04970 [Bdellovibrionales bacterium RIFOXYC1_FULL_54_43]OFZ84755.1 MAG: hypothetical protein A2603_16125 [Bdellovibrionales bacterium RIFOXYD1_FULL_55_31]
MKKRSSGVRPVRRVGRAEKVVVKPAEKPVHARRSPIVKSPKRELIVPAVEKLWSSLFLSPVHLDSALSKLPNTMKSALATIVPTLLLRPVSTIEALGVGVPSGEPWSLTLEQLAAWRPMAIAAQRLNELRTGSSPVREMRPVLEDFPPRILEDWKRDWGSEVMNELVLVLGKEAPLGLRAARGLGADELLKRLTEGSRLPVRAERSHFAPFGVRLASYAPVLGLEVYQSGGFEIQDEGSQIMALFALWPEIFAPLLQAKPGRVPATNFSVTPDRLTFKAVPASVVDACAGAGGKSLAIADALGGKGRVFAYDTVSAKLQALKRRASRGGLRNIQVLELKEGQEQATLQRFKNSADIVLVDAPCTGWGVLRRNPDIKWRQKIDVLDRMPSIQQRLLNEYAELVAPGGRLVYGVCTFRMAETVSVIRNFLEQHPAFEEEEGGFLGPGPCDGFYMKSMRKKGA